VVHGSGLDEISLAGPTMVAELAQGTIRCFTIEPEDAGLGRCEPAALRGGEADDNAAMARQILAGVEGPRRDVVLLNAAAALVVAERAADLREGVRQAAESIDDGRAASLLERVKEVSRA
jgi:anthranilate phosphoribosyltransferase